MKKLITLVVAAFAFSMTATSYGELKEGDQAPNFSLAGSDGATHTLTEMRCKYVVVAFFPKAYTKG